jgi:hypothetical protein
MQKMRSVVVGAVLAVVMLGGSPGQPVSLARAAASADDPSGKGSGVLTAAPVGEPAMASGMLAQLAVKPGTYVVRTVWKDAPLTKARVEWRRQVDDAHPALVGDTLRVGTATFRPEPGTYYLTADWRPDGDFKRPRRPGDRFAWFGGNPRLVSSETSEVITLILEEVPLPPLRPPLTGTGIFGRVTLDGVPLANVGVYAYAKTGSGFKGDDFQAVVRTNGAGEFVMNLAPDQYYLLARLRADNSIDIGPLHRDDLLGFDAGNPLVVVKGGFSPAAIPLTRLKMVKSRAESAAFRPGTIEGRIVDLEGRPVPGAYAALYGKPNMSGRSLFRSDPVGADGRFKLSVPIPGNYFLSARSGYGTPENGWFGAWDGNPDHLLSIKSGEVRAEVEIIVNRLSKQAGAAEIHEAE